MCLVYIHSSIDFAAPLLALVQDRRLGRVEDIQNEAVRIILGCPRISKVFDMRKELSFPSIRERITEVNLLAGIEMLRQKHPNPSTKLFQTFLSKEKHSSRRIT